MTLKSSRDKLGDPVLLDKIDQLLAANLGDHIDLPQLVVVGDQSSGKSSVLEGLTRLPFPRDSGLCTRFATQIIFRRSHDGKGRTIAASIIPASDTDSEHTAELKQWRASNMETLDAESFASMMSEVHDAMGLSRPDSDETLSKPAFSKDVFRLEICGPDEDHLSVVDVPGIFKLPIPGRTSQKDIGIVRNMVLGYMQNPRSIMLTVIPANVDIATQDILEMAREADPEGDRTLGVFTKPDLVDEGAEPRIMELIERRKSELKLGWSIVRNPGQKQLSDKSTDRDTVEADFFRDETPWNSLDKDKVGVAALKIRLQEIQTKHTRREFPKVRAELSKKLKAKKDAHQALGAERDTTKKQSDYLLEIITRFQEITSQALVTNYANDLFDENDDIRLMTALRNRNDVFKDDMADYGHEYSFASTGNYQNAFDLPSSIPWPDTVETKDIEHVVARKKKNLAELEDILYDQEILYPPCDEDILDWIEGLYRKSRGFEIGTFNPALLSTIMKKQSTKWTALALGYTSDVITMIHNFIVGVLERVCPDDRVRENLLSVLMGDLIKRYKEAERQIEFLLHVERVGTPMTLRDFSKEDPSCGGYEEAGRRKKAETQVSMSNTRHTVQHIHDILKAYYEVASQRFVDNVCMQATDYHLVTGPSTPLKLFAPSFVTGLTAEQLESLAGEEAGVRRKRGQLKKEIEELEAGRKIVL